MNPEKLLSEWMTRLGLSDWRIALSYKCTPQEMKLENVDGCSVWEESIKSATIQILDERYYGERVVKYDFERILVHELLHLKTCFISDTGNDLQDRVAHQIIDDLARAFVDAKRNKSTKEKG